MPKCAAEATFSHRSRHPSYFQRVLWVLICCLTTQSGTPERLATFELLIEAFSSPVSDLVRFRDALQHRELRRSGPKASAQPARRLPASPPPVLTNLA